MATINETMSDAAAGADTGYSMTPGDSFTGRLGERFDEDWIRIELQAGLAYDINLTGDGSDGADDTILRIYNAAGEQVAMNDDVDFAAGNLYSMVSFTPVSNGVYYISAATYTANPNQENWGDYRITVSNPGGSGPMGEESNDDVPDTGQIVDVPDEDSSVAGGYRGELEDYDNEIEGTDGADVLTGTEENDEFYGSPGADAIRGGSGNDNVSYLDSDTGIEVRLYDGTARGGYAEGDMFPGRQTIEYQDSQGRTQQAVVPDIENLSGSEHDDILIGDPGGNELNGNGGDDRIEGREGDDRLFGDDWFLIRFSSSTPGDDYLDGGRGDDWLDGGRGADELRGGPGNDTASYRYSGDYMGVEVRLYDGTARNQDAEGDTFVGTKTIDYVDTEGNRQEITVPDIENLFGSIGNDILAGAHGPNRLDGYEGDDLLYGREGDDWLEGGDGWDTLEGGPGADTLRGGPGIDSAVYELSDAGVVVRLHTVLEEGGKGGHAEGDTFNGETYTLTNDDGTTREVEVPDIWNLFGSNHDDILAGDFRQNWIDGLGGDDLLYGGPDGGPDFLFGSNGDDKLYGGKGNDALYGGHGDDLLRGGPGNDALESALEVLDRERSTDFETHFKIERYDYGDDQLYGGTGNDYFYFYPDGGEDIILDFGDGEDRIVLSAFEDIQSLADLSLLQQGDNLIIDLSGQGGGTITLEDFNEAGLLEEQFVFFTDDSATAA